MDEGLNTENKTEQISKTEQEMISSRPADPVEEWESAMSDTESLVQERAYQQQLQLNLSHHEQNKYTLAQKNNGYCSLSSDDENNDIEYLHVYDSLEEAAHLHSKRSPTVPQSTHNEKREGRSQHLSVDAYSDLRYDPNWRSNLKAADHFKESTLPSVKKYDEVQKKRSCQPCANGQEVVLKGGYSYIADTHPGVVVTSPPAPTQSDRPYHLHPPDCQTGSGISLSDNKYSLQPGSQEAHFSSPSPKYGEDKHSVHIQRLKAYNQQGPGGAEGGANKPLQTLAQTIPKVRSRRKLEGLTKDIVRRNKVTLGCDKPEHSSYMMVHALKKTPNKISKVTQINKEKKENSNPPQQCSPAPGNRAEQEDGLTSPLARQASLTQPKHLEMPPTINLNINLNTLSHLLPFQQRVQAEVINLASLQGCPLWISTSEVEVTHSPPYLPKNQAEFSQMFQKGVEPQLLNKNFETSPETRLRVAACKWPLSHQGVKKKKSLNEVYCQESPQQLPGTPTTTLSPGSGPHTVLPPIGKPLRGRGVEMIPGQNVDTAEPIHRSSSDSYLVQMERRKQKGRGTHKALDCTDYKQLKSKINLQGRGPNYKVMDEAKLKRQKLYSNVIQEQNKKISRIPFLLTKDPQINNKTGPRMKALEYAKTIAKRPVQSQPKQRQEHQSESITEHASCMEGLDVFQPAALDVLRRRHEEEKQLVALFRKVHAV